MKPEERLLLDNQLCFALYSASLSMTQLYKEHLQPLGLTYPQYTVMLILWQQDGISLKSVADRLGQKSGSLTPVIKRMEKDGLIQRIRGVEDDRSLSIRLTEAGKKMKEKALGVNQCVSQACGISDKEISTLRQLLVDLRESLQK